MSRQYKNAPIEEALCEFHFSFDEMIDPTLVPGMIYPRIQSQYPGSPRQQRRIDAQFRPDDEAEPLSTFEMRNVALRTQFPSADGTRLVGVGPASLSVHLLRPYAPGWDDDFRPRLHAAIKHYSEVFKPQGVFRIGLRYINVILVKGPLDDYSRLFRSAPGSVSIEFPARPQAFLARNEYRLIDPPVRLMLTHATADAPDPDYRFILDLDLIWESANHITIDEALPFADRLHEMENSAFEAMITDDLRSMLDE